MISTQRCSRKCLQPHSASSFPSLSSLFLSGINSSKATQCFYCPSHNCLALATIMDCSLISEYLEVLLGHLILDCPRLLSFYPSQCPLNSRNVCLSAPQPVHSTETNERSVCLYSAAKASVCSFSFQGVATEEAFPFVPLSPLFFRLFQLICH